MDSSAIYMQCSKFVTDALHYLKKNLDITLQVELESGQMVKFKANKLILKISSTYFEQLFESYPEEQDFFLLTGIDGFMLLKVLEFTHNGSTSFAHQHASERFLQTGKYLGLKFLDHKDVIDAEEKREAEVEETNQLFKQISKCISLGYETQEQQQKKNGGSLNSSKDSALEDCSISSDSTSSSSSSPIKATKRFGMSGEYWQCQDCQYWCFRDGDIRRHEARNKCQTKSSSSSTTSSKSSSTPIKAMKVTGSCGDYWRCQDCQYWSFRKNDIRQHENLHKVETDQTRVAKVLRRSYKIRTRALKRAGVCGSYYQCNKCSFWDYKKQGVRRHQENKKH